MDCAATHLAVVLEATCTVYGHRFIILRVFQHPRRSVSCLQPADTKNRELLSGHKIDRSSNLAQECLHDLHFSGSFVVFTSNSG